MKPIQFDYLDLAVSAAKRSWEKTEGAFHYRMAANPKFDDAALQNWLSFWMLSRTNPRNLRRPLLDYFNNEAIHLIIDADDSNAFSMVQYVARRGNDLGIFSGVATSTVSKLAFTLKPSLFNPYDMRVRKGLKAFLGTSIRDHDYINYMHCFKLFKRHLGASLPNAIQARLIEDDINDNEGASVSLNRVADKYLMLVGGFSVDRMRRDADC
jgi:hypothetical protein